MRLTAAQQRMQNAIRSLASYMATYEDQHGCLDYNDDTFIEDVLYGLGTALEPVDHRWATGFDKFKAVLREHLKGGK